MNAPFGSPAFMRWLEIEVQRQALISLLILVIVFAIVMFVLYHVIRMAIRDGLKESGMVQTWRTTVTKARDGRDDQRGGPDTLPDMRAER